MVPAYLLIIDVQKGFVNDWTRAIPARVEDLQHRSARVAVTRFLNPEGSMHRRLIHWSRFAPGSEEAELAFVPRPDAWTFDKTTYTAATPDLLGHLREAGIDTVHLCGIATDNCVLKTAVDLFEAGIRPVVLADACASHGGPDCHAAGLLLLRRFIGMEQVAEGGLSSMTSSRKVSP